MYAQKFRVEVLIRGERRVCPLEWLDQFCMRNFTNSAEFDDQLPVAEGQVEAAARKRGRRAGSGGSVESLRTRTLVTALVTGRRWVNLRRARSCLPGRCGLREAL